LGHVNEARQYISWLMNKCKDSKILSDPSKLQAVYGLRGRENMEEEILTHLSGYRGSKPVRVGNNAYEQEQWDIYGSLLDVIWHLYQLKGKSVLVETTWKTLCAIANHVVVIWRKPDEGLWEVQGGKNHFVYSKVMCWVALDRVLKLQSACGFEGDTDTWIREMASIKTEVLTRGWNKKLKSFTQSFDSDELDASLLLLPVVGFIEGTDPRMLSTIRMIQKGLKSSEEGILYRYTSSDGLPGKEGAFLLASFWLVDALVLAGKNEEAKELFERLLPLSNHVGLYSEELNPTDKTFLGNFPQAYTHIGLINSAMRLSEAGLAPDEKESGFSA